MDTSDLCWKDFESKQDGEDVATFSGVASTSDLDLHGDIMEPGCFGSISKKLPILRDHNLNHLIGGWSEFVQDGKNLKVQGAISLSPDVPKGRETYTLMKQGFLTGISVGYRVKPGGAMWDDASGVRRIKKAHLLEASIVSIPANQNARVRSVKCDGVLISRLAMREWLKDNGFGDAEIDIAMTKGLEALVPVERAPPLVGIDGHLPLDTETALATELRGLLTAYQERRCHV